MDLQFDRGKDRRDTGGVGVGGWCDALRRYAFCAKIGAIFASKSDSCNARLVLRVLW